MKSRKVLLWLEWQGQPSKSTCTIFETVAFSAFLWHPGVNYLYLETPSKSCNGALGARSHWPPMEDINI